MTPAKTAAGKASSDRPNPRLEDFMCFAVYSANLAFGRAYKPILEKLGLTYTQYIAIVALWEQDNQTVGGLGEKLFLESNTLTPILKKLEELGYVQRKRDPADERQVIVHLTEAGRRLREKGLCMNLVKETGLSPEDFRHLQKGIVALRNNLARAAKASRS
ncbi:MarR family transcriptional regulator [[Pseudomonas] carboxydohydrogena]|uniref:MarR family transcriptional regulator n=1 Tax=Afipia carboxydohydrogena TaxID=290 RepID=A0ABY8BPB4_AFICR|nr:MarR family transcriptional regulator [[Pseudomonas] carboxydohydrogena]WEF51832.1 MarR family transcriptional regulator [[Pseudomonas] carboxydohydrogena]